VSELPADIREHNRKLIAEFRGAGGALPDRPLLLLTTTGARSGRRHTTPMMYVEIDGRLLVIASNAGAVQHPDWFRNLVADPSVTVEHAGEVYEATAVVPSGDERDRLFGEIVARYPIFAEHQSRVTRRIPVVELAR
jgi:deazaflavin-dependent oxidoreductase (nitroreductase family)